MKDGRFLQRRLVVTNTNLPMLIAVQRLFGGKIHGHSRAYKGRRISFEWYCYGEVATEVLRRVLPHLRGKRREAEVFVTVGDDRSRDPNDWRRIRPDHLIAAQAAAEEIREIRARSWTAADVPASCKPPAQRKTHCSEGHAFTEENTKIVGGYRACRICSRRHKREQFARKMERKRKGIGGV